MCVCCGSADSWLMSSAEVPLQNAPARQQNLVRGLVLWVSLLTLTQAVTLALFAWTAHVQDRYSKPPEQPSQHWGKEFTINRYGSGMEVSKIQWVSDYNEKPEFDIDGLYFLYVQVTLQTSASEHLYTVQVRKSGGDDNLLEHTFTKRNGESFTTGFLGRQVLLVAKDELTVICHPAALVNTSSAASFMGVYLLKAY